MKRTLLNMGVIGLAGWLSACASIVSENQSATYIETDPEKARCELHGQDFKRVVETPNSLVLPAAAAPITVACKADGYKTTTETLDTKLDGWIFGNILFGGIIGVAVDAARGAGEKFPPQFSMILEPERFASEAARDDFYDRRRRMAEDKWARVMDEIRNQCTSSELGSPSDCDAKLKEARERREKEIDEIERRRLNAAVSS